MIPPILNSGTVELQPSLDAGPCELRFVGRAGESLDDRQGE
jgi:hypothetical protein